MTLYPDIPSQRNRQILADVLTVGLIVLFIWVGMRIHDLVADLAVLATGIHQTGSNLQDGFNSVAGSVAHIPVVGDPLSQAFTSAGQNSGGNLANLGQAGEDAVNLLARAVGITVAALPILVLLVAVLPRRIRGIREMTAARKITGLVATDSEHARLLAMRAAFGLPFRELLAYTNDPFADLAAGRYDALATAALADVGLRPK